jgi:uncharacterized membrane protein required for colicin V production
MTIEWWMIDGAVALIVLIAAITGAAKGIGDTVFRLVGIAGGLVLSVLYSGKVAEYLTGTSINTKLHDHIYEIIRGNELNQVEAPVEDGGSGLIDTLVPQDNVYQNSLSKALGGIINDVADKTAEAAADKLTQVAISIMAFVLIILAVWLAVSLVRLIFKKLRDESIVIGGLDRIGGFALGIVRGLIVACVAIAALVPVTTLVAPLKVPAIIDALHSTYIAGIIYDINPVLFLVKLVLS